MTDLIIKAIEEEIVPYVASHGGTLVFHDFKDGVVRVRMSGACHRCSALNITLKFGVERMLRRKFEEVDRVELLKD